MRPTQVLSPRNVRLEIRVAYVYRAHWEAGAYDPKYLPAVEAAREGLRLLSGIGVRLEPLSPSDWDWLAGHCDDAVGRAWRERTPPFDDETVGLRQKMDAFIGTFLGNCLSETLAAEPRDRAEIAAEPRDRAEIAGTAAGAERGGSGDTCGDAGGILASAHVGLREALPTTPGA